MTRQQLKALGINSKGYSKNRISKGVEIHKQNNVKSHYAWVFKCVFCPAEFNAIHYVTKHAIKAHNSNLLFSPALKCAWVFKCTMCPTELPTIPKMVEHATSVHKIKNIYSCGICSSYFKEESIWSNHNKQVHERTKSKELSCSECSASFDYKVVLKNHIELHLEISKLSISNELASEYGLNITNDSRRTDEEKTDNDPLVHEEEKLLHKCQSCNVSFKKQEHAESSQCLSCDISFKSKSMPKDCKKSFKDKIHKQEKTIKIGDKVSNESDLNIGLNAIKNTQQNDIILEDISSDSSDGEGNASTTTSISNTPLPTQKNDILLEDISSDSSDGEGNTSTTTSISNTPLPTPKMGPVLNVRCRSTLAVMHTAKYESGSKGKCIQLGVTKEWLTPNEFEDFAGSKPKNYLSSIKCLGRPLKFYVKSGELKCTQQNHDISVHEEEKFHKCLSCNVSFDSIYLLNDHNKSLHDEIHLEKIVAKKPKILKEFVSKHTFDKNEDSAQKKSSKHQVTSVHEKEKPYKCPSCNDSFKSQIYLKWHIGFAHDEDNVPEIKTPQKDNDDEVTSQGDESNIEGSMKCLFCNSNFVNSSALEAHLRISKSCMKAVSEHMKEIKKSAIKNEQASKDSKKSKKLLSDLSLTSKNMLDTHRKTAHSVQRTQEQKSNDDKVHEEKKPYKCKFCELAFANIKGQLILE